jgi:hypothetical protein
MRHSEFKIGGEFRCGGATWRTTDIGTRVIVAIRIDDGDGFASWRLSGPCATMPWAEAEAAGWFNGPPYAVEEAVFDENDIAGCIRKDSGEDDRTERRAAVGCE